MEQDMARRGSAEAQRHLGFRRLLGQGLEADPGDSGFRVSTRDSGGEQKRKRPLLGQT